ncbi:hypothetical protein O0544_15865 [Edwardsiella anguillarum]|nr:hypothetical protein [Edwardsiella anguillarum]
MANGRRWFTLILCFLMVTALFLLSHSYTRPTAVSPSRRAYVRGCCCICCRGLSCVRWRAVSGC